MNYEDYLNLVTKRRTIRKFKSTPVTKEDVKKIIKVGSLAPSGFNAQPWEFAVVQDEALRKEMVGYMQAAMKGLEPGSIEPNMGQTFATAPTFILIYGDSKVRNFGLPHIKTDRDAWMFTLNLTLAAATQQMHLAATSLGLASMWVSAIRKPGVDRRVKELLGVPEDMILFELMAVGYGDSEPKSRKVRELDEMIHWDKQGNEDYRTYEDVAAYFGK